MSFNFRILCGLSALLALSVQSAQPVFARNAPPEGGPVRSPDESIRSTQQQKDLIDMKLEQARQWEMRGVEFLKGGYADDAIYAFNKAIAVPTTFPPSADAYAGLADAQVIKGLYKEAEASYRLAVGLVVPAHGMSRELDGDLQMRFALLLSKMGKYDDAIKMYQWGGRLLHLDKDDIKSLDLPFFALKFDKPLFEAAAHTALGREYAMHANREEAIAHLQQAVALKPEFALAQYYLGDTLTSVHRKAEARAAFKKASELGKGAIQEKADAALVRGY